MMPLPVSDEVLEQLVEDMNSVSDDLQQTSVDLRDSVTILTKENEVKKNVVDEQKKRPYLTQTERKRFSLMSTIFESSFFQKLRDFRDQTLKEKAMTIAKTAFAPVSLAWKAGRKVWKAESIFTKILKWLGIGFLIFQLFGDKIKNIWENINPDIREPIENVANRVISIFEELAGYIRKSVADWFLNGGITNMLSDFFGKDVRPALNKIFELFYNSSDNEYAEYWDTISSLTQNVTLPQEEINKILQVPQAANQTKFVWLNTGEGVESLNTKLIESQREYVPSQNIVDPESFNAAMKSLFSNNEWQDFLRNINDSQQSVLKKATKESINEILPENLRKNEEIQKNLEILYKSKDAKIDWEQAKKSMETVSQKQLEEDAKKQAELTEELNKEMNTEAIRESTAAAAEPFIKEMERIVKTLNGDVLTIDLTEALTQSVDRLTEGVTKRIGESLNTIKASVEEWVKNTRINLATTVQAKAAEITVTNEKGDNIQNTTTEIDQNNITKQGNVEDIKATININNMNLPSLEKSIIDMNAKQKQQITLLEAQNKSLSSVLESMTSFSRSATFYFSQIKGSNTGGKSNGSVFILNNPGTTNSGFYNATTLKNTQETNALAFTS